MMKLKYSAALFVAVALFAPSTLSGQSLGEVAKKEKKRRKDNRQTGEKVRVLSERDLASGESPESTSTSDAEGTDAQKEEAQNTGPRNTAMPEEITLSSSIPLEAPIAERNRIFDRMKELYLEELANIEVKLSANAQRIEEIDRELAKEGASGLPIAPTADQAMAVNAGTETPELTSEKTSLQRENEQLETTKANLKQSLIDKGRRGGIAESKLSF